MVPATAEDSSVVQFKKSHEVEIFLRDETVWLTQAKIANLFGVDRSVVAKHLQNIFQDGELDKKTTCAKFAQVQTESEYQKYRVVQGRMFESDFDCEIKQKGLQGA